MSQVTLYISLLSLLLSSPSWADEVGPSKDKPVNAEASAPKTPSADKVTEGAEAESLASPAPRTGFSLALGGALTTCLPQGSADCSNTFPGGALAGALESRFWYLGLGLEFDYGLHIVTGTGADEVSSAATHITPMLKGYYPLQGWELFMGVGLGYSAVSVSEERSESSASWSSFWQGVKLSAGLWYDLQPHGLPEGFTLDVAAQLFLNSGGSRCTAYAGSESCFSVDELDPEQRDVANHLQLHMALRYTF